MVTLTTIVRVPSQVVFHVLDGETVLLNLESGKYYGLDSIGTRMFTLLSEQGRLDWVVQALLTEYEVEEERLQADLMKLVEDLIAQGLLTGENLTGK